jgi:hypothetical protein
VLPLFVLGAAIAGRLALRKRHERSWQAAALAFTVVWTAAAIAGAVVFPQSAARFFPPMAIAVFLFWLAYSLAFRGQLWRRELAGIAVLSAAVGGALPWTQRAPEPDTRPSGGPPRVAESPADGDSPPLLSLDATHRLATADGTVRTALGELTVDVEPLLTFESRSPDRCWTILAPRDARQPPRRQLTSLRHGEGQAALTFDDSIARHWLSVASEADGGTSIEVESQVAEPVYSHLNSFCNVFVRGHKRLELGFSPCQEARIEVLPSDYPVGQPRRMAYFADETLHVVEARSGEKGPFRTLASGPLPADEPLEITLYDEGQPVARVVLEDWAAQCGRQLSPTAGWGLPVNAIEFSLLGDAPTSTAAVWITLAGTSVGRGWDSVGHRAGSYRNRVRVDAIGDSHPAPDEGGQAQAD